MGQDPVQVSDAIEFFRPGGRHQGVEEALAEYKGWPECYGAYLVGGRRQMIRSLMFASLVM